MATYTAGDQINRALRMLGVLAEGETPSASTSNDALMALNQMIDAWSIESLSVYSTTDQTLVWPANQASQTLGPTGTLVGFRPVMLDASTYYTLNNISYPIEMISDYDFNDLAVKSVTSNLPAYMNVTEQNPNVQISLWPIPTVNLTFHFMSNIILAQPATLATILAFPPGYLRAFTYNLALEIAPEYGIDPAKDIRRIAADSKMKISRVNSPIDVLQMPGGLC